MSDQHDAMIRLQASIDQYVANCRPMLRSLAGFSEAAVQAVADALTLRVANFFLGGMFGPGMPS